jgi:hypothetical protein
MILPDNCIPISLGYHCFVRVFLQENVQATPRYPFDWAGTPMWAVCELMDSNFEGMNSREHLVVRRRFSDSTEEYLTHTKYNMVFLHDYGTNPRSITDATYTRVEDDYKRRIERWHTALSGKQHLVFFRVEMPNRPRVTYEGYARGPTTEIEALCEFAEKLKARGTTFHIVHITHSQPQGYDAERRIIHLNFTPKDHHMVLFGRHIHAILQANQSFLRECLTRE